MALQDPLHILSGAVAKFYIVFIDYFVKFMIFWKVLL